MKKLRLAFVVYGGIDRKDWRTITKNDIQFDPYELKTKLISVIQRNFLANTKSQEHWAQDMIEIYQTAISNLLPFNENEMIFFNKLLDDGEIDPLLLTADENLQKRISMHPGLLWKAQNVKNFKAKADL